MCEIKKEKSCGAIILKQQHGDFKTLVVRQNQGHWGFPKGHVENDETEYETAKREVKEEVGLDIEIVDGFREVTSYSPAPYVYKDVIYFLAKETGGQLIKQDAEIAEIRWVSFIEAFALLTYENDVKLLRKANRYIKVLQDEEFI